TEVLHPRAAGEKVLLKRIGVLSNRRNDPVAGYDDFACHDQGFAWMYSMISDTLMPFRSAGPPDFRSAYSATSRKSSSLPRVFSSSELRSRRSMLSRPRSSTRRLSDFTVRF